MGVMPITIVECERIPNQIITSVTLRRLPNCEVGNWTNAGGVDTCD